MKLPPIARVRIPILITIVFVEIVGFVYFFANRSYGPNGTRIFAVFVFLSLIGLPLAVPLLWLDWMRRRRVVYYRVFLAVGFGLFTFSSWQRGERLYALLFALGSVLLVAAILIRLLTRVTPEQQQENLEFVTAEQNELGPITKYTVALVVWLGLMAWSWSQAKRPIPLWAAIPMALPSVWFTWQLVYHVFKRSKIGGASHVRN